MKIIGHRGAKGQAAENTIDSLISAKESGVDAVEFDVRLTADNKVVLVHRHVFKFLPYKQLPKLSDVKKNINKNIITLDKALNVLGGMHSMIEIKDPKMAKHIAKIVKKHPDSSVSFGSFIHKELRDIKKLLPDKKVYVLEHISPIDIIYNAKSVHAAGIGINKWLINPLTYWLAKRKKLEIYVYTVNNKIIAKVLSFLYPGIAICTDHPARLVESK